MSAIRVNAAKIDLKAQCRALGLPVPQGGSPADEVVFAPPRKWRFDWAWPALTPPVALEVDGGVYVQGRHTRGKGFTGDLRKLNRAVALGWTVYRFTPEMLKAGEHIAILEHALLQKTCRICNKLLDKADYACDPSVDYSRPFDHRPFLIHAACVPVACKLLAEGMQREGGCRAR